MKDFCYLKQRLFISLHCISISSTLKEGCGPGIFEFSTKECFVICLVLSLVHGSEEEVNHMKRLQMDA